MFSKTFWTFTLLAALQFCWQPAAEAGPLLDWLRSKCNRNQNVPTGNLQATSGTFTQAPTTLLPGQCQKTCMQTCQRTVVNYVPYTAYRTEWQRVPVTQYRPVTNTDPCSGCTVTCMRPCTSYSWQLQRKPYTTYRPVYQNYNYQVPVTTISNDCATGNCNSCSTCGIPAANSVPAAGGFVPSGTTADTVPTISNRPYYGVYDTYPVPSNYQAYPAPVITTPVYEGAMAPTYAAPGAYSGMTQYSGYGTVSDPYTAPMPSSFVAPQPGSEPSSNNAADQVPLLQNSTSSNQPNVQSVLSNAQEASGLNDPAPDMRWDFNVPPLSRPEDQSALREVQVRWAYTPANGATWSDSFPAASSAAPVQSAGPEVNSEWKSTGDRKDVNHYWN